jgi:ABC-type Mn2+/Zn2+ transport system ATPase subunit
MTTHDFAMLPKYANQVILVEQSIVCSGTPEEVLSSEGFAKVFHRKGGML